ncbi:diguanylate cyclase [Halomonas mongoliensis]|uniref:diguanylate cyclase n=1 Tax=Halomonas mongoliensis TaxID=321265 RepID=UPI00403AD4E3
MNPRQHVVLGWQLALCFTLLVGLCALAIGLYVVNARQHVGANYTALVADVVRAQQHSSLLRSELLAVNAPTWNPDAERFENMLWRTRQHLQGVTHGLTHSQLDPQYYRTPLARLQEAHNSLPELEARIDEAMANRSHEAMLELGLAVENDLAWAYSELNEYIHQAAAEQRILMERLTLAIGILVLLVLLVVGGLMLALLRLNRQRSRLAQLSRVDTLTGLHNRRHLLEEADKLYRLSLRDTRPLSLVLIDLDHFKRINDSYGHPAGDRLLQALSQALREETREVDVVARLGGEEFCILMPDTPAPGAMEAAERVRARVQALPLEQPRVAEPVTVSLGLATGAAHEAVFDRLYFRADRALYAAKAKGRNRTEIG